MPSDRPAPAGCRAVVTSALLRSSLVSQAPNSLVNGISLWSGVYWNRCSSTWLQQIPLFLFLLLIKGWTWLLCLVLDCPIQYLLQELSCSFILYYSLKDTIANAAVLTEVKGGLLKPHLKNKIEGSLFWPTRPLVCSQSYDQSSAFKDLGARSCSSVGSCPHSCD